MSVSEATLAAAKPIGQAFPIDAVRARFPALKAAGSFVYMDNAAGAQCPQNVLDRTANHLLNFDVQRGGRYPKSLEVDRTHRRRA